MSIIPSILNIYQVKKQGGGVHQFERVPQFELIRYILPKRLAIILVCLLSICIKPYPKVPMRSEIVNDERQTNDHSTNDYAMPDVGANAPKDTRPT